MKYDQPALLTVRPLLAALLVAVPSLAAAQPAGLATPDAGSILRQIQPIMPRPTAPSGAPLTIDQDKTVPLSPGAPFLVNTIRITGNKKIDTATLHALVAEGEGKNLTLAQLEKLVDRITEYYRRNGYPVARAIIPAQTITGGVVEVQIIVARYGKIVLDNRSRINDPLLLATLSPLKIGDEMEQKKLDQALLLISDIPGVVVNARLKPGDAVGTSDLQVTTTAGPSIAANAVVDNYGNRYTGRARVGGTVNLIDPLNLRFSNVLSLSALSTGRGMNYGRVAYESVVNGMGSRLGGSYSALRYKLGEQLTSLNAHGTAQVGSLFAKHPFLRSRDSNVYGQIQYDRLQLRDRIDLTATETDRHLDNWTVGLVGDARDAFLSGSLSTWSLSRTGGRVGFNNDKAKSIDVASASTQGGFSRWNANLSHLQSLGSKDGLYLSLSSQWANGNLDSSQKMSLGGPYSVRAYDTGAVSGDTGYQGTAEFRHNLGSDLGLTGQLQAIAFVDSANVTINKNPWSTATNTASLSGAGLGLNWAGPNQWNAKAAFAKPIGSKPELLGTTKSARAWLELNKGF